MTDPVEQNFRYGAARFQARCDWQIALIKKAKKFRVRFVISLGFIWGACFGLHFFEHNFRWATFDASAGGLFCVLIWRFWTGIISTHREIKALSASGKMLTQAALERHLAERGF